MRRTVLACVPIIAAACGGSSSSPTAPSTTGGSITIEVALESPAIISGTTTNARGTTRRPDGSTQPITTGWLSDTPAVATVTDAGVVTGVGTGLANIYVVSSGTLGQALVKVVPDFRGEWPRPYTILTCSQTADIVADFCAGFRPGTGTRFPGSWQVMQSGDAATVRFFLSSSAAGTTWDVPIAVTISNDGALPIVWVQENRTRDGVYRGIPFDITETITFRRSGSTLVQVGTATRQFRLPGTTVVVATQTLQY